MNYKITEKVIGLVEKLISEGYKGEPVITDCYATGTREILGKVLSIRLPGFCKESLHLVEDLDEGVIMFVGRYNHEGAYSDPQVSHVVAEAWGMYKYYQARGYEMPHEFQRLFIKYGYVKETVVTQTIMEEL